MPGIQRLPAGIFDQLNAADTALHNGDARLRKGVWSHHDPVTLFGAVVSKVGWEEIGKSFEWLASRFSNGQRFDVEVLDAGMSGDLAYLVAIEHTVVSVGGAPPAPYDLRVTTILRREHGQWKVAHRHGSPVDAASGENVGRL